MALRPPGGEGVTHFVASLQVQALSWRSISELGNLALGLSSRVAVINPWHTHSPFQSHSTPRAMQAGRQSGSLGRPTVSTDLHSPVRVPT